MATDPRAGQSRRHSAFECATNIAFGWLLSIAINATVLPALGGSITLEQNLAVCAVFTVVSFLRSFVVRRAFLRLGIG